MPDYRETVEKLRTMRAHFDSLLGTLTHDERATFDETVALLTEQDAELATLREWKAREQSFLLAAAAELLDAGYHGDDVLGGIKFLRGELADEREQVERLKPGGMFAWKDKFQRAEAELATLRAENVRLLLALEAVQKLRAVSKESR